MFGFQIKQAQTERQGSICAGPDISQEGYAFVVVMWDDDYSFSTLEVGSFKAVPNPELAREEMASVAQFPGKDDTIN